MTHTELCQSGEICAKSIESDERFGKTLISEVVDTLGTSIFIESQLPAFVREDHPRFIAFLESYYKWLDQNNNTGEKIKKLREQQDIDSALPQFAEQFYKEFLVNLPRTALTNKKVLLKYIKQFYRAKGTEKSYKLFFRMLYDTRVDFYYPSKDILRLSDGKWTQRKILRVFPQKGNGNDFQNKKIIGNQNKVTAFVDEVREIFVDGYNGYELVLNTSSISGTLLPNEIIVTEDGSVSARISPIPTTHQFVYDINSQKNKTGSGYKVGDVFKILNDTGRGARIKVTSILPSKKTVTETITTPIGDDDSTKSINLGNKNISAIVSIISANDGGRFQKEPKSTTQVDPDGTLHETVLPYYELQQDELGNSILVLKEDYESLIKGRVRVQYEHMIEDGTGEIDNLQIINFGAEYSTYDNDKLRKFNIQLNSECCVSDNFTGDGEAELIITSNAVGTYPGFYSNEDGHLSSSKYIQDGEYYQQYSYVIITDRTVDEYKAPLSNMLHPLGFKLFGKFRVQNLFKSGLKLASRSGNSTFRREFKQFPRPQQPGKNLALTATVRAKTFISLVKSTTQERSSRGLGPSNCSIFRERFNYKPNEKYDNYSDVSGINSEYWGAATDFTTQFSNNSISKFMHIIPITLEGISDQVKNGLKSVQDAQKQNLNPIFGRDPQRCDMIYNSTYNIVELYDGDKWVEVGPNRRINILPDFVLTTTGPLLSENGDLELKLSSVRSMGTLGMPQISLL